MELVRMKKILVWVTLSLVLFAGQKVNAMDREEQLYAELLMRDNTLHVKVAAQSIYNKKIENIELVDIAAEVLGQSVMQGNSLNTDTQAWLAKAIGASGNQRYTNFLNKILDLDVTSKLKKYVKKSLKHLVNKSDTEFILGKINLAAASSVIDKNQLVSKPVATQDSFNSVHTGDTINQVFGKLGNPDNIEVVFGTKRQHWVGDVSYSMLKLVYKELGKLNLYFSLKSQNDWVVRQVLSDKPFDGQLSQHPMMDESPLMVRSYIKGLIQQTSATELDRDLIAERLYRDLNNEDFADALSWGCKLLGLSGNGRYRSVLESTIENSTLRKLRKYAKKSLKKIPQGDVKQYQQGNVYKKLSAD